MLDVGIVGLGLIGGSIGLNLIQGMNVAGYDSDPEVISEALERRAISHGLVSLSGLADAKLIFIATPPNSVAQIAKELFSIIREDAVITDCSGVKKNIISQISDSSPEVLSRFIGGHPMAGKESGGIRSAEVNLFEGASWILTPVESSLSWAMEMVEGTVQTFGATPVCMSPEQHDQRVAAVSHLPHVLAGALVQLAQSDNSSEIGAGAWADLTRVASSDPKLWTEIILANSSAVADRIDELQVNLGQISHFIRTRNEKGIRSFFDDSAEAKIAELRF